jgi:hypothetical protein
VSIDVAIIVVCGRSLELGKGYPSNMPLEVEQVGGNPTGSIKLKHT